MNQIPRGFQTPEKGTPIKTHSTGSGAPEHILQKVNENFYQVYVKELVGIRPYRYQSEVKAEGSYDYCLGYFHAKYKE